ncbi:MAG: M48 family metallopeptidase [Clostridiales bacterium]|nr:M48 family metallopeptidase [Clostridiales bacterium]
MEQYKIEHGDIVLVVNLISVNTRYVDITVNDDFSVSMRIPVGMHQDMAEKYIHMNESRILEEYERKKNRNHQAIPETMDLVNGRILYHSGQKLPFLGDMNLRLQVKYLSVGKETHLYVDEDSQGGRTLTVRTDNDSQDFLRYCVTRYYRRCTTDVVTRKATEFGKKMNLRFNKVQITGLTQHSGTGISRFSYKNIEIRDQKTLWGRCSRKKGLKFDWKLVMLPVEVIDYIIVHELTHLKKMNHSSSFWSEMEKIMPEYRECQNWLNRHGKEYEIF